MARQGIFTGFTPNDGLGDSLASGAVKINANFQEIYNTFGDGNNLAANAGAGGTWSKASTYGISTSKYVGIGTELPSSQLHVEGNVLLAGITTGTFVGDGSGLTGVTATGSGIVLKDDGVQRGTAQTLNFGPRLDVGTIFQGSVDITVADYVSYATLAGLSSYTPLAGVATYSDYSPLAGVATYASSAGVATYATVAGIVTYSSASGVATNAGVAEYAKVAGVSTYTPTAGIATLAGYAHTAGIATVAQNLTGNPSITIENVNSISGIVTFPGQGSKMRFDFDSTGDLPNASSWRGMYAYANNTKSAYVSFGTTNGGYNGWRRILAEDVHGNYETTGILTAAAFAGDASALYNLPSTDSIWRSNPTGIVTSANVGIGTTNAEEKLSVLGNFLLKGRIVGTATTNVLPFLYSTYADLPSASVYHGAFAHVHETGKAYYAHSGNWIELVNKETSGYVGTGTENYNVADISSSGVVTATAFIGDGSGLTGITASGTGIEIKDEGVLVGTAGTINFVGTAVTTTFGAGIATVTISSAGGGGSSLNDLSDVVVSSPSINQQLIFTGSVWQNKSGIGTVNADGVSLSFGTSNDLEIYHSGAESIIRDNATGDLKLLGDRVLIGNPSNNSFGAIFNPAGSLELNYNNSKKFATTGYGVSVTGGQTVTGVVTALAFVGDGSGLTGVVGSGSGIVIQEEGSSVGTAGTINFVGTGVTATFSGGIATVEITTTSGGGEVVGSAGTWAVNAAGIHTSKNVGIGTELSSSALWVEGDGRFSGVVTATRFESTSAGTPTIDSPNNLNINAVNVAISTDLTVGRSLYVAGVTTANSTGLDIIGVTTSTSFKTNSTVGDGSDVGFAIKYYVTANGTSAYLFAGPGLLNTTDNPTFYLQRGFTYIFENSTGGTHPFRIQFTGTTTGVGTYVSGSQTGTQVFTVPFDAPSSYEYQCTIHGAMLGTFNVA